MSLTSLLDLKDVRDQFKAAFPKPDVSSTGEMLAPPRTKNYSLVGTAFDYLLRFYIEKQVPFARSKSWIANYALLQESLDRTTRRLVQTILEDAKKHHRDYLEDGVVTDDLLRSCLLLAQLDPMFRRAAIVQNLGKIEPLDILDLRKLLSIVPTELTDARYLCLLDPTFGKASSLVGGADVDLVIDGNLIDIKTTIKPALQREHYHQIVGYYILYHLSGIDGTPPNHTIHKLMIYSARYGTLHTFPVEGLTRSGGFNAFVEWFVARTEQEFGTVFKDDPKPKRWLRLF